MKILLIAGLTIFCLAACDSNTQKMNAVNSTKTQDAAQQEAQKMQVERDRIESEAKSNFNQAFSYLGSAKAATDVNEKSKLFLSAEKEFTNAIEKKPDFVDALLNRGVLYIVLGKTNKAEEDLKRALSLDATNAAVLYNLACLYSIANKVDLAIDSLDAALKNGFNDYDRLRSDSDLKKLRSSKEFKAVLEKHKVFIK